MCFVSSVLTVLFCCWMAVAMWNCCRLGAHFVYTIQLSTRFTVSHHVKPHTRVQVCLDVTCHLHFWQNDQNLLVLFAAAVTWGWNGCQNKCQRKKLTMGKKTLFLPGLKPVIFSNESSALTNEISLLPGTLFAQNVHALTTAILCCLAVLSISSQTTKSLRQRCSPFPEFPKLTISLILLLSIGCPLMHGYSTNLLPCATIASAGPPLSTWLNSWKVSNQPTSNALLLIFPFFVFPLWACTHLARDYLTLHHLCGAVSLC